MTKVENNSLGWRIRRARINKVVSQKELANAVFASVASICQYELGRRVPNSHMLQALANALDVSVPWLLGEDLSYTNEQEKLLVTLFRHLTDEQKQQAVAYLKSFL